MTPRLRYSYLFTCLWACCIAALTLLPAPAPSAEPVFDIPHIDKAVHFIMFGLLAAVWMWEYSCKHGLQEISRRRFAIIAAATAAIGGADELLQGYLTADRTADLWDWLADALGAFTVPALCHPLIRRAQSSHAVRMKDIRDTKSLPGFMEQLYLNSFPPEERRDWSQILRMTSDRHHPLHLMLITFSDKPAGLLTWWNFGDFRYVEHFAVNPEMRGNGIGKKAIEAFVRGSRSAVVLEVEPEATGEMARRRIGFYKRCGFTPHADYIYIQPPYGPGLAEVPLTLMTAGGSAVTGADLEKIDQTLKTMVYGEGLKY